jgi:hypothetical protein
VGLSAVAQPELSVVIASHNTAAVIGQTLAALCAQPGIEREEIIVADSSSDGTPAIVCGFDGVRLLHADEPLTLPELRGRGIAAARGRIIAIVDPFAVVADGWRAAVLAAHARVPNPVIGGAVDLHGNARGSLSAWALFINEYGMFMPPAEGGAVTIVPGCNVSYKRAALFDGQTPRYPVFWKTFVNWELEAAGAALWLAPEILVRLWKPIPFGEFLASRFDHGRCFAGMRAAEWDAVRRSLRAATAAVIPGLLLWRWSRVYWAKGRFRAKLLATLPQQVLLFGMWAVGEAVGYLAGTGRSCRRLFY